MLFFLAAPRLVGLVYTLSMFRFTGVIVLCVDIVRGLMTSKD